MRNFTIQPVSEETRHFHQALSRRLDRMARGVEDVGRGIVSLDGDQIDQMSADIRDMAKVARRLEDERLVVVVDPYVNPVIPQAIERMYAAEDLNTVSRQMLIGRLGERCADPDGTIVEGIDTAIAELQRARALVVGGRAVQS